MLRLDTRRSTRCGTVTGVRPPAALLQRNTLQYGIGLPLHCGRSLRPRIAFRIGRAIRNEAPAPFFVFHSIVIVRIITAVTLIIVIFIIVVIVITKMAPWPRPGA